MGPYIKNKKSAETIMINLVLALIPIIIFGIIKNGIIPYTRGNTNELFYPIIPIIISIISCTIFDTIYSLTIEKKKNIKRIIIENKSLYLPILLSLIIPIKTPIPIIIGGTFIYSTIKIILKKIEKIRINEVALAALLIILILKITGNYTEINKIMGTYEELVKPYGNITKMIIGMPKETLGQVSSLLCGIGFVFLTLTKSIKWKIPLAYILTIFGVTYVVGGINDLGLWYPIYQIIAGGLVFIGIYIITEEETTPTTPVGQMLFGMFAGILTIILTYLLQFNIGTALLSIIIMNLITPILDKIGAYARFNFKIALIPFIIAWVLILILSLVISIKY